MPPNSTSARALSSRLTALKRFRDEDVGAEFF
jgi:hypothetical protein